MTPPPTSTDPRPPRPRRARTTVAWLVLGIGVLAAIGVAIAWDSGQRRVAEARLTGRVAEASAGVAARVGDITETAASVAGLYDASVTVEPSELRGFLTALARGRTLEEQVPGLEGVLLVQPFGAGFELDDAFPSVVESSVRGEALGGTRVVREALNRSTDLGLPVLSAPVPVEARDDLRADIVVAVPVYRTAEPRSPTSTVATRRSQIERWVVALVDADDLLDEVAPSAGRSVALAAYAGTDATDAARLGAVPPDHVVGSPEDALGRTVVVNLQDAAWLLQVEALPGFLSPFERAQPFLVLLVGLGLAASLFALTYVLATSRARALTMVDEATAELARSNEELRSFTGVVSHDLKSPLTGVIGFLELLDRDGAELGDRERGFVQMAGRSANRMRELIDRLLSYARSGSLTGEHEPVDLQQLVEGLAAEFQVQLDERDGTLEVGELPTVVGDEGRLEQVLQNLIGNAVKFVPSERPPHVRVAARRDADHWIVTVADNGVGIAAADRESALRPFERTARTAGYEGTGLGLAICDRIVRAHGGHLELDDSDLGGTAVRVVLPATSPAAATATTSTA